MCKMFEVVTGRKSKGSVDKLEGLTKAYTDIHEDIAIIRIPVELMEVDSRYQTDERTERDLKYLTNNWDERKLMPLLGVPHWEEGKVYIVDGYGRWIASQIVDKDKYKDSFLVDSLGKTIYPNYYTGSYVNTTYELVIGIVGDTSVYRDEIRKILGNNLFLITECEYSYNHLLSKSIVR